MEAEMTRNPALAIQVANFNFDFGGPPILQDVSLELPAGARCLLVGRNGSGKSTLLRILAGKRLVKGDVYVLGAKAFLESPAGVTYLGTEWAGDPLVRRDVLVSDMIRSMGGDIHSTRRDELIRILDISTQWRMHQISDGERRRVQCVLGLLSPWHVLLLDEVTTDLDILVRTDLLKYLKRETLLRGATIVYATHIFDGLADWPTHLVHLRDGKVADTVTLVPLRPPPSSVSLIGEASVVADGEYPADPMDQDHASPVADAFLQALQATQLQDMTDQMSGLGLGQQTAVTTDISTTMQVPPRTDSPLFCLVESWLRRDFGIELARRTAGQSVEQGGPQPTRWDELSNNAKKYGDRYYNYYSEA